MAPSMQSNRAMESEQVVCRQPAIHTKGGKAAVLATGFVTASVVYVAVLDLVLMGAAGVIASAFMGAACWLFKLEGYCSACGGPAQLHQKGKPKRPDAAQLKRGDSCSSFKTRPNNTSEAPKAPAGSQRAAAPGTVAAAAAATEAAAISMEPKSAALSPEASTHQTPGSSPSDAEMQLANEAQALRSRLTTSQALASRLQSELGIVKGSWAEATEAWESAVAELEALRDELERVKAENLTLRSHLHVS